MSRLPPPRKLCKFYIQKCACWCICSGFEQLLECTTKVAKMVNACCVFMPACFTPFMCRNSNRSVVLPFISNQDVLRCFDLRPHLTVIGPITVVLIACSFAAGRWPITRDGDICRFNDCVGNRCAHLTCLASILIKAEANCDFGQCLSRLHLYTITTPARCHLSTHSCH